MSYTIYYELAAALSLAILAGIVVWKIAKANREEFAAAEEQLKNWHLDEPSVRAKLEGQLSELNVQVPKLNEEIKSLNEKYNTLTAENTSLKAETEQVKNKIKSLKLARLRRFFLMFKADQERAKEETIVNTMRVVDELFKLGDETWVRQWFSQIQSAALRAKMQQQPQPQPASDTVEHDTGAPLHRTHNKPPDAAETSHPSPHLDFGRHHKPPRKERYPY